MRTIAVINQKGGCGKTTTSINLAAGLARRGFRTLLVDLDPQSHCAAGLGVPEDRMDLDISDALRAPADGKLDHDRLLWRVGRGLDLLPSRMKLAGLEAARGGLADMDQPQSRLKLVLDRITRSSPPDDAASPIDALGEPARRYDAVIIDCPPAIGLLSYNALAAASEVLIPVETSYFSLRGAGKQIQTARSVARHVGVEPRVRLLATMFDPSLPLARDLLDDLRDRFGAAVVPLAIRMDPEVKEAASFGRPVEEHAPESMGATDYASLCEWVIERAGLDRPEPGTDERGMDKPRLPEQTLEARPLPEDMRPSGSVSPISEQDRSEAGQASAAAPMSRAQEIALRAASMPKEARPATRAMHPPKPIAIELSTEPVVDPSLHPAAPLPRSEPNAEALRHLWGVCGVEGGLFFVQPATGVGSVAVVGDFNGWDPSAGEMTRRSDLGIFECRIECPPGRFHYRLVIDGEWRCDAYNPARVPNGLGGENNLAVV
ncbi:MAG: AAA family ATPase [Phycisphaerales bacterium]